MKKIFLIVLISISSVSYSQYFELGGQKNFLENSKPFENTESYSGSVSLGRNFGKVPIYLGFKGTYFVLNDKLIEQNKYNSILLGGEFGVRPLAPFLIIRLQPFVEVNYVYALGKKDPALKSVLGFGGGLEFFITRKASIRAYYGYEVYQFNTSEKLNNAVARVSFRFPLPF